METPPPGHRQIRHQTQLEKSHSLAGVWHLTADSTQILEAVPDGVDVGHAHEHNFTVGIIL